MFQQLEDRNTLRRQGAETSPAHCTPVWDWPPACWVGGVPGAFAMDPPLSTAGPGLPPEQIQAGPNIPIRAVGCSTGQMIGKCFCRSVALQGHQIWVATTEHPKGRPAGTMQHLHPRLMLKPSSMTQQMQHRQRLGGGCGVCVCVKLQDPTTSPHLLSSMVIF